MNESPSRALPTVILPGMMLLAYWMVLVRTSDTRPERPPAPPTWYSPPTWMEVGETIGPDDPWVVSFLSADAIYREAEVLIAAGNRDEARHKLWTLVYEFPDFPAGQSAIWRLCEIDRGEVIRWLQSLDLVPVGRTPSTDIDLRIGFDLGSSAEPLHSVSSKRSNDPIEEWDLTQWRLRGIIRVRILRDGKSEWFEWKSSRTPARDAVPPRSP